jgi:hypothetical protein
MKNRLIILTVLNLTFSKRVVLRTGLSSKEEAAAYAQSYFSFWDLPNSRIKF